MTIILGNRLAEFRKKMGYSQEELANNLKLSRQSISKWERGEASPDTDNLIALAKLYGVSVDDLINTEISIEDVLEKKIKNKEKEKFNNAFNKDKNNSGIYIKSKDGDEVFVNWDGIHINDNIKNDGYDTYRFEENLNHNSNCFYNNYRKKNIITSIIDSLSLIAILTAYVILGFTLENNVGWVEFWPLFLLFPIPLNIYECINKRSIIRFNISFVVLFVYLFLGMKFSMWHPYWAMLAIIPAFYIIFNPIEKLMKLSKNDIKVEKNSIDVEPLDSQD